MEQLRAEFGDLFDPCPHPIPAGYNGLEASWRSPAYCNPPFGRGTLPSAWTKKAITEAAAGKTVALCIPAYLDRELKRAWSAGAVIRPVGPIRWLELETRAPNPNEGPFIFLAIWNAEDR